MMPLRNDMGRFAVWRRSACVTDDHDMIGEGDNVVRFGRRSATIASHLMACLLVASKGSEA
jgi:hypothetical protein